MKNSRIITVLVLSTVMITGIVISGEAKDKQASEELGLDENTFVFFADNGAVRMNPNVRRSVCLRKHTSFFKEQTE